MCGKVRTAAELAEELKVAARRLEGVAPGLANCARERVAVLSRAPAAEPGWTWLARNGDEAAEVAERFCPSRSGTFPAGRR